MELTNGEPNFLDIHNITYRERNGHKQYDALQIIKTLTQYKTSTLFETNAYSILGVTAVDLYPNQET